MSSHVFLLFALLLCNVLMRAFTGGLHILPGLFNVVDIPIVGLLFLTGLSRRGTPPEWSRKISRKVLLFCIVLLLGTVLNPGYLYFTANVSQWIMLLEPLILFVAVINLPFSEGQIASYCKLLRRLIVFEVILGVLQLPMRFASGDTEAVHGTFPGNAEQYAAFVMLGVFYLMGAALLNPEKKKQYMVAALMILVLIISIDNKASWLGIAVSLGLLVWRLDMIKVRMLRILGPVLVIGGLGLFIGFIARTTSGTTSKFDRLMEAARTGNVLNLGKIKAYLDIARSAWSNPHMMLVGAGPSNFYSRASRQFYCSPKMLSAMYNNPDALQSSEGEEVAHVGSGKASDSLGGAMAITTAIPYYFKFYGNGKNLIYAVGSIQVDSPFSPYAGLLGETGIIGTWLYLGIYLFVFSKLWSWIPLYRDDTQIFPLLVCCCGFVIYLLANSIYGPFIETTRYTTILWSMIGLVTIYVQQREQSVFEEQTEEPIDELVPTRPFAGQTR